MVFKNVIVLIRMYHSFKVRQLYNKLLLTIPISGSTGVFDLKAKAKPKKELLQNRLRTIRSSTKLEITECNVYMNMVIQILNFQF